MDLQRATLDELVEEFQRRKQKGFIVLRDSDAEGNSAIGVSPTRGTSKRDITYAVVKLAMHYEPRLRDCLPRELLAELGSGLGRIGAN
jgi:hypothetical protein